jgi:hypothetical protein
MYVERSICISVMCFGNHAACDAHKKHRLAINATKLPYHCSSPYLRIRFGLIRDLRHLSNPMQLMGDSCLMQPSHHVLDRLTCAFDGSLAFDPREQITKICRSAAAWAVGHVSRAEHTHGEQTAGSDSLELWQGQLGHSGGF